LRGQHRRARERNALVKSRAPRWQRRNNHTPFGYELAMLARGESIVAVLWSFCGDCSAGRAWHRAFMATLTRIPTRTKRRRVLAQWLRLFNGAKHWNGGFYVRDAAGYIGRQHREVFREKIDPETGEVDVELAIGHVPAIEAGGLAARDRIAPRTVNRYRRDMRQSPTPVMVSKRCPWNGRGAVRPQTEGSRFAYAHHFLPMAPSAEMARRWGHDLPAQYDLPNLDVSLERMPDDPERLRALYREIARDQVPY
jgi:hypothetical protein